MSTGFVWKVKSSKRPAERFEIDGLDNQTVLAGLNWLSEYKIGRWYGRVLCRVPASTDDELWRNKPEEIDITPKVLEAIATLNGQPSAAGEAAKKAAAEAAKKAAAEAAKKAAAEAAKKAAAEAAKKAAAEAEGGMDLEEELEEDGDGDENAFRCSDIFASLSPSRSVNLSFLKDNFMQAAAETTEEAAANVAPVQQPAVTTPAVVEVTPAAEDKEKAKPAKKRKAADTGTPAPKKAKKAKKDSDAPKRPANAFILFKSASTAAIKEQNPTATAGEVAKVASEQWKAMSAEQKQPYEDTYKQNKAKFEENRKAYELKKQAAQVPETTDVQ